MITDNETNHLYLSDRLNKDYPEFCKNFIAELQKHQIEPNILPGTKDVWAVDFMPIQINKNEFIQFRYEPDYLREYPEQRNSASEISRICNKIKNRDKNLTNIKIISSNIIVDGGNVVRGNDTVIMCDKVFHENPNYGFNELTGKLKKALAIEKIIFVPWNPNS
jgi:agmatine deiminase